MTTDGTMDAADEPVEPAGPARAPTPWEGVEPTVEFVPPEPVAAADERVDDAAGDVATAGAAQRHTVDEDVVDQDDAVDDEAALAIPIDAGGGGWWTIPMLCLGIAIIACALVIPAADENRRIAYETERLTVDLAHVQQQIAVNDEFLRRLADDPNLSERLARRQMKMVREGTNVMELKGGRADTSLSPFLLVTVPPPPEMPAYRPVAGVLASLFQHPKTQLYLMGTGLLMIAAGLVMGQSAAPRARRT